MTAARGKGTIPDDVVRAVSVGLLVDREMVQALAVEVLALRARNRQWESSLNITGDEGDEFDVADLRAEVLALRGVARAVANLGQEASDWLAPQFSAMQIFDCLDGDRPQPAPDTTT